ncbi:MAG: RagB/SusD family nutrient uptake outer membrane protein [Niastella sp.]|nr:RagB/SusD family nutrient uptake outer membrane protein [Niastella sp.]
MKQLKYNLFILVLCSCSLSCSKSFLDVEDDSVILREQYVNNINSLQQYLNGVYIQLGRNLYEGVNGHRISGELVADNIKPSARNSFLLLSHYIWNQSNGMNDYGFYNGADGFWKDCYQFIRDCSFVIEKANELSKGDPAQTNQIIGEALSLRALGYFILVNTFAQSYNFSANGNHPGVPYVTSWDWNDPFHRNTVKEVYDGMIADLAKAIPMLTPNNNNKIVMNQLAAKALLARIFLFKEDWQQAKTLSREVSIAVPLLASEKYPAKLFTPDETEALFQLSPSSTTLLNGSYTTSFEGYYFKSAFTFFTATKDISTLLNQDQNDSRKNWIITSSNGIDSIRKYPSNVLSGFGTSERERNRSYYLTIFRSSEMFLTVAEASAQMGDEGTARNYLDAIRKRANPAASNSTVTGTALLDSIYLERRKELAFEGFRMWDLLRWKKGVNRKDAAVGAPLVLPYPSNKSIAPLPLKDVNYGMPQNPSY